MGKFHSRGYVVVRRQRSGGFLENCQGEFSAASVHETWREAMDVREMMSCPRDWDVAQVQVGLIRIAHLEADPDAEGPAGGGT